MCCYRDVKNFERFYLVVQSILCLSVGQLKQLKDELIEAANRPTTPTDALQEKPSQDNPSDESSPPKSDEKDDSSEDNCTSETTENPIQEPPCTESIQKNEMPTESEKSKELEDDDEEPEYTLWSITQREKLMHILSKIFLLNFPLYLACKHSALSRLDDLSAQEITNLNSFCDLHDTEIPAYLLRNVSFFCKLGGVGAMINVFENASPAILPLSMAHAIVAAVGNLKLWLNFRAVAQLFMPLRTRILKYMCLLEDKDLRMPAVKSMAGNNCDQLVTTI